MKNTKKNNKKNTNKNKIIISIAAILLIILLIASGTYAYWTWTSDNTERTNVVITVPGATLTINGASMNATNLVPIPACYTALYHDGDTNIYTYVGKTTVVAKNDTNDAMTATLVLEGQFAENSTVTNTEKAYFKYAISEVSADDTSASSAICGASGVTSGGYKTGTFASVSTGSYTTIVSDLTFNVPANTTVTKYYQVYIWLDGSSTETTSQNQTINVKWSTSSTLA